MDCLGNEGIDAGSVAEIKHYQGKVVIQDSGPPCGYAGELAG